MRLILHPVVAVAATIAAAALTPQSASATAPHNVLLFVADGLRPGMVNSQNAPTMAALLQRGVRFPNSHSLFPTFTTANASAMATGHMLGDTGDFSNTIDAGFPVPGAGDSLTPFLESDPVLGDVDEHFAGNYLNEETVLAAARQAGLSTATIGKLGPVLIQDHMERTGQITIVVDDLTGRPGGIPLNKEVAARLTDANVALQSPTRGENAKAGTFSTPGTLSANIEQQDWFATIATDAVLPLFKSRTKPFVMVFWSRDPDGTQHNQGDSLGRLLPGINGPTSLAAIRNADNDLAKLLAALKAQGLDQVTDIILTADHGFSTISKDSATSFAAGQSYRDVPPHALPPGFVALDIAHALNAALFDPDAKYVLVAAGAYPSHGNGVIGTDPKKPDVVVAANGGSDLVYIPSGDKTTATCVIQFLLGQDYVSGLFVDPKLGDYPGTLPLSAIALDGSAVTPIPAIVVNFRTFTTGCADPMVCGVEVADTGLQQGQGMHGSFSRADTSINLGAIGPDFRKGFTDPAPVSNADVGMTIAHLLSLDIQAKGKLVGRVMTEAMPNGVTPQWQRGISRSQPDASGLTTVVEFQTLNDSHYFDAAGFPGRTLGLQEPGK